jgi:hypothetical protein
LPGVGNRENLSSSRKVLLTIEKEETRKNKDREQVTSSVVHVSGARFELQPDIPFRDGSVAQHGQDAIGHVQRANDSQLVVAGVQEST